MIGLLLVEWSFAGKKYGTNVLQKLPDDAVHIEDLAVATPTQDCLNWLWASEVETILKTQKINLPQTYWIVQANLGEVCVNADVDLDSIASLIDRDYQLDDGSKIHLQALRTEGAPSDIGHLILSLKQRRPLILLWNGRPLMVTGVTYGQYGYPNGQRMYEIHAIEMIDPAYPEGDERRVRKFVKGTDNPSEIGGMLEVIAMPVDPFRD